MRLYWKQLSFLHANLPFLPDSRYEHSGNKRQVNNFQMLMPTGRDAFNLEYDREYFYITTTVRKSDGKIVHAGMFNVLDLKLRVNCKLDFTHCKGEYPFSMLRNLKLELL
jgi:hypothetical protein